MERTPAFEPPRAVVREHMLPQSMVTLNLGEASKGQPLLAGSSEEIERLRAVFDLIDTDSSGTSALRLR